MLLFLSIAGFSRCKVWVRLFLLPLLILYCLKCQRFGAIEFLGGMFFAEISLIRTARAEAGITTTPKPPVVTESEGSEELGLRLLACLPH